MTFEEWWRDYAFNPHMWEGRETVDSARAGWLAAIQVERERCAKLCEAHAEAAWDQEAGALNCAAQIRAGEG